MRMLNVVTAIAVCGGLWCGVAASCQAADGPQRWALLVGVDQYDYARGLKYCVADQKALGAALVTAGFQTRQVTLMTEAATDARLRPSKTNLKTQIELLCQLAERGDFVLIGFSGHGVLIEKTSYLCPSDAKLDDPETLISLDWVYKQLSTCKADLRLMMVDACRNVPPEPEGRRAATPKELQATSRTFVKEAERLPEGVLLLNSCSEGEFAQEHDPLGHGVFTHFLLQGLQGKADKDANQKISLQELFSYASKETSFYVRDKFADIQRPKLKGNLAVEVLDYEVAVVSPSRPLDGDTTLTNTLGMKLVSIPAGEFEMGSRLTTKELAAKFSQWDAKESYFEGERPPHRVKLTSDFYLGQHEVTVGQFRKFVADDGYQTEAESDGKGGYGFDEAEGSFAQDAKYTWKNPGFTQTDAHPVVNVSWNDAQKFCAWLSQKEGKPYRLPTEAEWEYACKAGTNTLWSNGDDPEGTAKIGNAADGTLKAKISSLKAISARDGYVFTAPVGQFPANAFGLFDMHGNAFEWCEDVYDAKLYGQRTGTTTDPRQTSGSELRVLRGGSWDVVPLYTRSADRSWDSPDDRNSRIGFRLARTR